MKLASLLSSEFYRRMCRNSMHNGKSERCVSRSTVCW